MVTGQWRPMLEMKEPTYMPALTCSEVHKRHLQTQSAMLTKTTTTAATTTTNEGDTEDDERNGNQDIEDGEDCVEDEGVVLLRAE